MRTNESSPRSYLSALAGICLIALALSFITAAAEASSSFRFGADIRYIEATFRAYQWSTTYREIVNTEWADVVGLRLEYSKRWSVSETASIGIAPGFSLFFLGGWQTDGGPSGTLDGGISIGGEVAVPVEFAVNVSDKFEVGSQVGLAFSGFGFNEPETLASGVEQDCYEGGIGWTIFDLFFGVHASYRISEKVGLLARYRFAAAELGGAADYKDDPEPQDLTNGGPQLMVDYRFGD